MEGNIGTAVITQSNHDLAGSRQVLLQYLERLGVGRLRLTFILSAPARSHLRSFCGCGASSPHS